MLSIGTVSAGNQAQREYHERQLAQSRDDYYRETEGPAGVWIGAQAEAFRLSGEVDIEMFRRMLDGQDPATGEDLGGRMDRRKTVAFDLAFSAPKSVSLLRMAADEGTAKTVDRAHERAVKAALSYIEEEGWKARARVTHEDGSRERVTVQGTGVIGVLYRHETTRNADPQLHSHAVLANVVRPEKGDAQAINSPVLYQQAKTAGSVYQAVLRGELGRELGIEFDTPVNGLSDIKGFDRGLIETFSTRRAEILEGLARAGFSAGGAAAERVALESRRAKDMQLDHGQWRVEVRQALQRDGFGIEQAQALVRTPAERELALSGAGGGVEVPRPRSLEERLQAAPLDQLTDVRATEDARLIRQVAMSAREGFTADEVTKALSGVFDDPRLVQVQGGERPRWTTERHLQLEHRVQRDTLGRMQDATAPRIDVEGYTAPTKTPDGSDLSPEQRQVLGQVLTSGHGVEVIRARAGAGKTTIAGLARAEFEAHGIKVLGVAPTLQALAELDDVGLEKRDSLARTAFSDGEFSEVMRTMDHQTVVLVDEAGMAQTREIAPLLDRAAERGAKVVAIGDDVQLAAVGAGGWFRYLVEHQDAPVLALSEVHRQRDPVERDRLNGLHRGDVAGWIRWADQHDRIDVQLTVQDAYEATVSRFESALDAVDSEIDRVVVMAPQNTHRRALNDQLRRVVADRGVLDRTQERDYDGLLVAPGERLVATKTVTVEGTSRRLVENGERFEVLTVDAAGARARAVAGKRRGELVQLPAEILRPDKDGRRVDHAYARTVHKAQGMTVDRSILFAPDPGRLGRNLAYVGLTRTRDRADLVTVASDRPAGLERLVRGMSERRDHQAALAIASPKRLDPERVTRMSVPELAEHRHALLTEARQAMTRLSRLDREARGAWAGSADARTDANLVSHRDQLVAQIEARERHLAEQDPDGKKQGRGLMEQTTRQALERDRGALERLDEQLVGREVQGVPEADELQARIQKARRPAESYLKHLLERLDHVHGQQADRTATVDPLSVPEHERPALALTQEAARSEQLRSLTVLAAQQLGTGHSQVASWLERHPLPHAATQTRSAERKAPARRYSPHQQAFADALDAWHRSRGEWATPQGARDAQELSGTHDRLERAHEELTSATVRRDAHLIDEPSRLRRTAHREWNAVLGSVQQRVDRAQRRLADLQQQRDAVENRLGRPFEELVAESRDATLQTLIAERDARELEHALARRGPEGFGIKRTEKLLGPRDGLNPQDQRRYDKLAGQIAVDHVLRDQPTTDRQQRWPTLNDLKNIGREIALWRDAHDLPLTERQQQIAERHRPIERDHGIDLGFGFDR